ncbi:hypothetical protein FACS1894218_3200 [Bacilli bacterium]|nr:hypothetical protein FACS1894218_3200 [Bacilli bacterium]
MGLKTILSAKKIILVALGSSNASAVNELMNGRYLHSCPVTSLIYHHDVTVCLDLESASLFDNK